MTVEKDKYVSIHYTLKNDEGTVIDSSVGKEPLGYVQGRGYLLPKLEEQIDGKNPGDKFHAVLEPIDGYGEKREDLISEVPRSNFETDMPISIGMAFQAMTAGGPIIVRVVKVEDDKVTVDGNHELAGVRLNFDVEIVEVRDATEDELNPSRGCGGGCGGCGGGCGGDCGGDGECGCGSDGGCGGNCGCQN